MKQDTQRIQVLLEKYRDNQCNREEFEELIELAQNPGNEQVIKEVTQMDWEQNPLQIPVSPVSSHKSNLKIRSTILKVAASVAILVAIGIGLTQWASANSPIEYITGNGEVKEVVLPDGSEVTMNANTRLTWILSHDKNDDRLVKLVGEAFFEVIKEVESTSRSSDYRGFRVETPKMTIKVLGTAFNVAARQQNTEVFLQEGSVELQMPEEGDQAQLMIPGEKVVLDNRTGNLTRKESEKLSNSASWVAGILNYNDKSMGEVLQNLSELFGVEITCEDQDLRNKKINLGVPYMDWENTKRALEMAMGIEFRKKGETYMVLPKD